MALDRSLGARFGPIELPHAEGTDRHALIQQATFQRLVRNDRRQRPQRASSLDGWHTKSITRRGRISPTWPPTLRPAIIARRSGLDGDDVLLLECQILLQVAGVDGVEPKPARRAQVGRDTRHADGLSTPCVCAFRVWRAKVSLGSGLCCGMGLLPSSRRARQHPGEPEDTGHAFPLAARSTSFGNVFSKSFNRAQVGSTVIFAIESYMAST